MTEAFSSPIDPAAVVRHATGDFAGADVLRQQALSGMESTDSRFPGVLSTIALGADRQGQLDAALTLATEALGMQPPANEAEWRRSQRSDELPSVQLNAGTVLMRAAARLRLARNVGAAAPLQERAHAALTEARVGIDALRDGSRPHQWGINLRAREAALAAVEGKPWQTLRLGLGALALGFLSESPRFVQHTSRIAPTVRKTAVAAGSRPIVADVKAGLAMAKVKAKTIYRGAVATVALSPTALPGARNRRFVQNFRDRVLLHIT